jgi:hypothetical protein
LKDVVYSSWDTFDGETAELVAYQTSWSIWNAPPSLDCSLPKLWDLMSSWDSVGPASNEVSLEYSRYWLEFDAAEDWFVIYDLCRHAVLDGNILTARIKLSFCLSAAAYSESEYSDTVPFFIAFALDERFRYLSPPSDPFYTISDGVAPGLEHLEYLVSHYALPMEFIPAHVLNLEATTKKRRKKEYEEAIRMQSSAVANSIFRRWPDYESVDFREQCFYESECRQCIKEYSQSISRNIRLRAHVLKLQKILRRLGNVSIPTTLPYEFSPRFITSRSKASSYSICDVFSSCINAPIPSAASFLICDVFSSHINAPSPSPDELGLQLADLDSLKNLIEWFRNSQQPLQELYGNELNRSHLELMGQTASQSAQGAVPSHELLRLYHDECSHRRDDFFSEISAALAPSQNVEKVNAIAGRWPRITPRSLLRQLAQDHVGTLPDRWKDVIIRYAVCLLKYQQSRRLLELSSSQKHDELLRETDSMRGDVLEESTPDWLLVQVRPRYRRK